MSTRCLIGDEKEEIIHEMLMAFKAKNHIQAKRANWIYLPVGEKRIWRRVMFDLGTT
uniref:Uncharacterized protein n=1 Tax=Rhizophora mucronata TaxID=61149 RepID=A0A2P2NW38_RHIMU